MRRNTFIGNREGFLRSEIDSSAFRVSRFTIRGYRS